MKNSSQLKLLSTIRMTECTQNIQQSLMSWWKQSAADKIRFHSWCGLQSPNIGRHLWFSWNRGLWSTQISTLIIFWFQLLKRWKNIQKISLSPSNNIEHRLTPQDRCKCHFPRFWVRWCGFLHHLIWIQWTFQCGLCESRGLLCCLSKCWCFEDMSSERMG